MKGKHLGLGPMGSPFPTMAQLDAMVNESVYRAFINQSSVLTNSMHNLIKQTIDGFIYRELGYVGREVAAWEEKERGGG